ncbi:ribonucleoside-diphosphate reductase subunit alpha [Marispirochaeta aestuarii]|uniref:ribonucleoside-diphosphate reductase subunit alpha n=1 Tax=Marispirochaeta aestuarii TaxID=1963862 RepID=UPI002ABE1A7B|nr:ribonucleoside-diphosphate reductase subunit alpha [Marispirochaeta aestuarii]
MKWLTDLSRTFLERGYLAQGQTAEERIREIADTAERILGIENYSEKFFHYMSEGFYSLASPIWTNFGNKRGLPVSCFGSCINDNMGSILFSHAEAGMMSKLGGGTSGYFGKVRPRGSLITNNGESSGSVHFMRLFETLVDIVSQGSTRRGHFSPYLPIDHPDAAEFLAIGSEGNPIQKLTHGVCVNDQWMQEMIDGSREKRELWAKVIQMRMEKGYPYIFFTDNANKNTVDVYKDTGMKIHASNMCTEIMLPSDDSYSFTCVLSSINLLHYDRWKNTDAVETLVYFLDAVVTEFCQKLEVYRDSNNEEDRQTFLFMKRTYDFAKDHRAIGLGVLGWHSLLQSRMISFESREAAKLNLEIFKYIKEHSYKASEKLAGLYGEPELLKGYGRRNTTLNAIAPTTSSAFILGQVSQGIEPVWSNCYVKDIQKIKTTVKNPFLMDLLEKKGQNIPAVWSSIRDHDGSVQHLDFLSDEEKEVFKTYPEIDQMSIIYQAAARQEYIDQAQSLNIMIHPDTSVKLINQFYIAAWKLGIKSLYYQHSTNAAQKLNQKHICKACES